MKIIDLLEVIYVQHNNTGGLFAAGGPGELGADEAFHFSPIDKFSE